MQAMFEENGKRGCSVMYVEPEQVQLMQLQIDALSRAVFSMSSEMIKVGMAEVVVEHAERIEMGAWGIGLLTKGLGYKLKDIKN